MSLSRASYVAFAHFYPDRSMSWRRFDLNVKGVEGIQERTIGGGIVTLLSCVAAAFLLLSELSLWWTVSVTHRMHVDPDPVRPLVCVVVRSCSYLRRDRIRSACRLWPGMTN